MNVFTLSSINSPSILLYFVNFVLSLTSNLFVLTASREHFAMYFSNSFSVFLFLFSFFATAY